VFPCVVASSGAFEARERENVPSLKNGCCALNALSSKDACSGSFVTISWSGAAATLGDEYLLPYLIPRFLAIGRRLGRVILKGNSKSKQGFLSCCGRLKLFTHCARFNTTTAASSAPIVPRNFLNSSVCSGLINTSRRTNSRE